MTARFALSVAGRRVTNWANLTWSAAMQEMCASISATVRLKGSDDPESLGIIEGAPFELTLGDEFVTSGELEIIGREETGNGGVSFSVAGRDAGLDLVISDIDLGVWEFKNVSPVEFASKVAAPHGLTVKDLSGGAASVKTALISINPGTKGFQAIEQELRFCGCFTRIVKSTLEIYRPSTEHTGFLIGEETRLVRGSSSFDTSARFATYKVVANQRYGGAPTKGEAKDSEVKKASRVRIIMSEKAATDAEAKARAQWEMTVARGRSFACDLTLQGAGPEEGKIWRPSMVAGVKRKRIKVDSERLTVDRVSVTQDGSGTHSSLTFSLPDAFTPEPRPAKVRP